MSETFPGNEGQPPQPPMPPQGPPPPGPPGPPPMAPMKPHRGSTVLVLGIIALGTMWCYGIPGVVLGIIAWIMGNNDLREMDAGIMDPAGRSNTNAGRICGMVAVIVSILFIVLIVLAIALPLLLRHVKGV